MVATNNPQSPLFQTKEAEAVAGAGTWRLLCAGIYFEITPSFCSLATFGLMTARQ
jgi:hypothetical protein